MALSPITGSVTELPSLLMNVTVGPEGLDATVVIFGILMAPSWRNSSGWLKLGWKANRAETEPGNWCEVSKTKEICALELAGIWLGICELFVGEKTWVPLISANLDAFLLGDRSVRGPVHSTASQASQAPLPTTLPWTTVRPRATPVAGGDLLS